MARPSLLTKRLVGVSLFLGAMSQAAFAFEAEDVASALKAQLDRQQVELEWEAVRQEGSTVVLDGATAASTDAEIEGALPLGEIRLEDVSETDTGYRVENLDIASLSHEADDVKVSLSGLSISGLVLTKDAAADPYGGALRYERFEVDHVEARDEDDVLLGSIEDLRADMSISGEDQAMEIEGHPARFTVNTASLSKGENPRKTIEELGYEELTGSLEFSGRWRPSDGQVRLDRYALTLDDGGTLVLTGEISGYTPTFIRSVSEMTENMKASEGSSQGMAMLGMMQQISFHGLSVRFDDDSLSEKVVDLVASKQGGKREDVIAQAGAIIPMQLSPFLGTELANEVAQAVTTFLKAPDNIEISAQPSTPVPFAMLMGAAMGAPEMLAKQIGLTVKANQ
ncbi:hypothetical protein [Nitratireductor thuwali]|uniref:AsmA-like C-terminal domain-containing protein n=1 Tax=Nitratireductor thuwali TaxID=2267699 RepID=A0ABY5MMB0_9HYPH|nr:hypothetical protein NTH_03604 [Nitratireductor thuwali]